MRFQQSRQHLGQLSEGGELRSTFHSHPMDILQQFLRWIRIGEAGHASRGHVTHRRVRILAAFVESREQVLELTAEVLACGGTNDLQRLEGLDDGSGLFCAFRSVVSGPLIDGVDDRVPEVR